MSTAKIPSSSCEGSSTAHPLSFSLKKKIEGNTYITLQQSIIETYEMWEKWNRETPSLLNHTHAWLASLKLGVIVVFENVTFS